MVKIAPYGTWESPITAESIVQNAVSIDSVIVDPVTSAIYHVEKRPNEGGRNVLVKTETGVDLFGQEWNCRTGVEEYGGGAAAAYNGTLFFSNFKCGRVYQFKEGQEPEPITPPSDVHRFADFVIHPTHPHLIVSVLEDHTNPAPSDVATSLVVINSLTKTVHPLISGVDFYAAPTFSPDGGRIAWQQWRHPDMPWEGGEIYVGRVDVLGSGQGDPLKVANIAHVAGKYQEIAATHPFWVSNDVLIFTSDISGFQNPWSYTLSSRKASPILPSPLEEDFSLPGWLLGDSYGAPIHKTSNDDATQSSVIYTGFRDGRSRLYVLTLHSGALEELVCPYTTISNVRRVAEGHVVFIGTKVDESKSLVQCSIKDYSIPHFTTLGNHDSKKDGVPKVQGELISKPQAITLRIPSNGEPLYVVYYPPTNPEYRAPEGELPPGIIRAHGGPTGHETQNLDMTIQYFTSRGWAWIGVDYGGSSGHGRAYIERLKGNLGLVDPRDCVIAAQLLSSAPHNLIDPKRVVIRGGSAGGYTVLATLCAYPDVFAAGTSLYGISDLVKLAEFTHKFESLYMAKLLGGLVDDILEVYKERSPVNNASKIRSPLLIQQGSLDAVVPPGQAEDIVKTIREIGGNVEYVVFEGEGHGWRKAENIKTALELELDFYERVLKLKKQ